MDRAGLKQSPGPAPITASPREIVVDGGLETMAAEYLSRIRAAVAERVPVPRAGADPGHVLGRLGRPPGLPLARRELRVRAPLGRRGRDRVQVRVHDRHRPVHGRDRREHLRRAAADPRPQDLAGPLHRRDLRGRDRLPRGRRRGGREPLRLAPAGVRARPVRDDRRLRADRPDPVPELLSPLQEGDGGRRRDHRGRHVPELPLALPLAGRSGPRARRAGPRERGPPLLRRADHGLARHGPLPPLLHHVAPEAARRAPRRGLLPRAHAFRPVRPDPRVRAPRPPLALLPDPRVRGDERARPAGVRAGPDGPRSSATRSARSRSA